MSVLSVKNNGMTLLLFPSAFYIKTPVMPVNFFQNIANLAIKVLLFAYVCYKYALRNLIKVKM